MTLRDSQLQLLTAAGASLNDETFTLVNLSFGGMCFRTSAPLRKGDQRRFVIGLPPPFDRSVSVKVRICWESPLGGAERHLGAEFLESSTGWLGPSDTELE